MSIFMRGLQNYRNLSELQFEAYGLGEDANSWLEGDAIQGSFYDWESDKPTQTMSDFFTERNIDYIQKMGSRNKDMILGAQESFADAGFKSSSEEATRQSVAAGTDKFEKVKELMDESQQGAIRVTDEGSLVSRYNRQKENIRRAKAVARKGGALVGNIQDPRIQYSKTGFQGRGLDSLDYYDQFDAQFQERREAYAKMYNQESYDSIERDDYWGHDDHDWSTSVNKAAIDAQVLGDILGMRGDELQALDWEDGEWSRNTVQDKIEELRELFVSNNMSMDASMQELSDTENKLREETAQSMKKAATAGAIKRKQQAEELTATSEQSIRAAERKAEDAFQKGMSQIADGGSNKKKKVRGVSFNEGRAL